MDKIFFIPYPGATPILRAEVSETMGYSLPSMLQTIVDSESGTFRAELGCAKDSAVGKTIRAMVSRFPDDVRFSFKEAPEGGSILTLIIPRRKEV